MFGTTFYDMMKEFDQVVRGLRKQHVEEEHEHQHPCDEACMSE